tara:strand:- start:4547 stop:5491 length:945 start_codon:yes stop_codon:yes gene_type:complete
MKETIFLINHSVENCGVYQYGKRVAGVLNKSENYNFKYLELNDFEVFMTHVNEDKPTVIIYNHLTGTMPWFTNDTSQIIRGMGIKQGLLVHNVNYETFFDFYLHQDPNYQDNENNYHILRPLFEYDVPEDQDGSIIRIGTFGFGFKVKEYDKICEMVNNDFANDSVELNLHLTISHFCPNEDVINQLRRQCVDKITNPNIKLNITTEFMTDRGVLDFLNKNDLNVFFYHKYTSYNGISSVIDYALSAKKPIAICKSNMFSHIWDTQPSICVEDNNLKTILSNGFGSLNGKYNEWSNENFIKNVETTIKKIKKYV